MEPEKISRAHNENHSPRVTVVRTQIQMHIYLILNLEFLIIRHTGFTHLPILDLIIYHFYRYRDNTLHFIALLSFVTLSWKFTIWMNLLQLNC